MCNVRLCLTILLPVYLWVLTVVLDIAVVQPPHAIWPQGRLSQQEDGWVGGSMKQHMSQPHFVCLLQSPELVWMCAHLIWS